MLLGETPASLLEAFELKDIDAYRDFIRQWQTDARADALQEFQLIQGDLLSLRTKSNADIRMLVQKTDFIGVERLIDEKLMDAVMRIEDWSAYRSFRIDSSEKKAADFIEMLLKKGLVLANFQPLNDTRSPSEFAEAIGLYDALDKMQKWSFGTLEGRELVLSRIGIAAHPTSPQPALVENVAVQAPSAKTAAPQ